MGKENRELKAKLKKTTQTHSGSGDNIAAQRDVNITNFTQEKRTSESNEVETIMKLINFLSDSNNRKSIVIENEVNPNKKINERFIEYSESIKIQYESLLGIYSLSLKTAKQSIGLDSVMVEIVSNYLKDESHKILMENDFDPMKALYQMTDFFDEKLSQNNVKYDKQAIKFYLLDELIECNVFPIIKES